MTSAFCPPHAPRLIVARVPSPKTTLPPPISLESETEDEEVKLNCIGGFRGEEDSDMNTSCMEDEDDDSEASYFEDFVFEELVVPLKGGDAIESKDDSCAAAVQRKSVSEQSQSSRRRAFRNRRALAE